MVKAPFRFGEPHITSEIIEMKKFETGEDYSRLYSAEDDRESDSGSDLNFVSDKLCTATISSHGAEEAEFCLQQHISVRFLCQVWHATIMEALVQQLLSSLNFPIVDPIGMSQQFECQRNNPRKVLYVQGSRICGLFFHILATLWDTDMNFIELNLRAYPNALPCSGGISP